MAFTGKFVYMAHHFILLRLNPFGLRVDREGRWFGHSMSCSYGLQLKKKAQIETVSEEFSVKWTNVLYEAE